MYGPAYFGVDVPEQQRILHIASEAGAVGVAAPFLWWASNQTQDARARAGLRALALATLAIDGWLLWQWLERENARTSWGLPYR